MEEREVPNHESWLLVKCSPNSPDTLQIVARGKDGDGSNPPYASFLHDQSICFIVQRIHVVPEHLRDSQNARFAQPHYVLLRWQGEACSVMETALSSHHFTFFAKMATEALHTRGAAPQPGHYRVSDLKEVSRQRVIQYFKLESL